MRVGTRVVLALVCFFSLHSFAQTPLASSCAQDDHIDAKKRAAIENTALTFVRSFLSPDTAPAYALLTDEAKQQGSEASFATLGQSIAKSLEPRNIRVDHVYLVHVLSSSASGTMVCGELDDPHHWVALTINGASEQAYAVVSADGVNNRVALPVWMTSGNGSWKIQATYLLLTSEADKTLDDIWKLGRTEKARGHAFNATVLYGTAVLMSKNAIYQMGVFQPIMDEGSELKLPPEIDGGAPYFWHDGDRTYEVRTFQIMAIGGKLYLQFDWVPGAWPSDTAVDTTNKDVIAWFKRRFPEYKDVFAGIIMRAHKRDNSGGFTTVDDEPPAAPAVKH